MKVGLKSLGMAATVCCLAIAAPAAAVTYDALSEFSSINPSGVWSYLERAAPGGAITSLGPYQTGCYGQPTINCYQSLNLASGGVPAITKNVGPNPIFFVNTVVQPTDVLLLHPGPFADIVLRFTSPSAADYHYAGFFQTLDTSPNGVTLDINGALTDFFGAAANAGALTGGGKFNFSGDIHLDAGQTFDFAVGRYADYHFDSTGLSVQFAPADVSGPVPEPAAWALMILGFAGAGVALRRRRPALA